MSAVITFSSETLNPENTILSSLTMYYFFTAFYFLGMLFSWLGYNFLVAHVINLVIHSFYLIINC